MIKEFVELWDNAACLSGGYTYMVEDNYMVKKVDAEIVIKGE